ncbi:hypothetical protein Tco_1071314 [Tanacetum coccineum]
MSERDTLLQPESDDVDLISLQYMIGGMAEETDSFCLPSFKLLPLMSCPLQLLLRPQQGNMERLDDIQKFRGWKRTFGVGKVVITERDIQYVTRRIEVYSHNTNCLSGYIRNSKLSNESNGVIIVPSYANTQHFIELSAKDTSGDELRYSSSYSAEEIFNRSLRRAARASGQRAKPSDAKKI